MLTPGPDHPITLEPARRRWRARFDNSVIADTDAALVLREASLAPVVYFPRRDVAMEYMGRSDHRTHCPYKGDATYYTLRFDGDIEEDVAWSYEEPFDAMSRIRGMVAFDAARVEIYDIDDAVVNPHHDEDVARRAEALEARDETAAQPDIDDIIQHTDTGDGHSQREHWRTNVSMPGDRGLR